MKKLRDAGRATGAFLAFSMIDEFLLLGITAAILLNKFTNLHRYGIQIARNLDISDV